MPTAFVLSGGGSLGAVQAGMLAALAEAGVRPDLIVGTSVGALNGAWIASRPGDTGADALADLWRSVRRRDVFPIGPVTGLRGFLGRADHLVASHRLRRLVAANVEFDRLEDAPTPLVVVAADARTGDEVRIAAGDTVDAVLASAAIPAVFPPVTIGGRPLLDGAVADNTPIGAAADLGATTIWVLPTGFPCGCPKPPRGAIAMAVHAATLTLQHRLAVDAAAFAGRVELRIVPPPCPLAVSPFDFGHTAELIAAARATAQRWLESGDRCADALVRLTAHRHGVPDATPDASGASVVRPAGR